MATTTSLDASVSTRRLQRIYVVDDHAAYRRAIGSVIELTPGVHFAGEAASGSAALDALSPTSNDCLVEPPDLVVMDVYLGDMSGIDVTRQLLANLPSLRVLLVSTMAEADLPADAATCGAVGFVRKDRFGPAVLSQAVGDSD